MKTTFPELALLVTKTTEHGFFHVYAYPVLVGTEGRADSVRNVNDYTTVKGGWFLDNLRVYSQGSDSSKDVRLYGFEVEFHQSRVTLREVGRMAKTLKRIGAALDRLATKRGYVTSYGEYVARVAEVLGAKRMVFVQNERSHGWSHDDNDHAFVSLADGRARIEAMERKWAESLLPQPANA